MALRFFRQRQKMVMIIMVVLMFAFLLSSVIPSWLSGHPGEEVLGHVGSEEITAGMLQRSDVNLQLLLQRTLRLGDLRSPRLGEGAFLGFLVLNRSQQDQALAWTLLVHEARQMGVRISDEQADQLLQRSGLAGQARRQLLANLSLEKITERHLLEAAKEYLAVMEAYLACAPAAPPMLGGMPYLETSALPEPPPSMAQMRAAAWLLQEQIQLATVAFPAEEFVADAPEPTPTAIEEHFRAHRDLLANDETNQTDYGFGYRLPDRADLRWLFVDEDSVAQAVEIPDEKITRYWREHRGKLKKVIEVPVATTAPATGTATTPASAPAEPKTEQREVVITDITDALPQIRAALLPEVVDTQVAVLARRASELIEANAEAKDPYPEAVGALRAPADTLLQRPLDALPATTGTLSDVVRQLGERAGVKIVYPFGKHGKLSLDPKLHVKLAPRGPTTLGAVLEEIARQTHYHPIEWVACPMLPDAIFPHQPVDLSPVRAGRTGLVALDEINTHELLGWASTDREAGQPLAEVLRSARAFQGPQPRHVPLIEPGGDFRQTMYVTGARQGRLLWRLMSAEAEHAPSQLTPEIRAQVVRDLKIQAGMERARSAAEKMLRELPGKDLEKLAKGAQRAYRKTEPFGRKQARMWLDWDLRMTVMMTHARRLARRITDQESANAYIQAASGALSGLQAIYTILASGPEIRSYTTPQVLPFGPDRRAARNTSLSNERLVEEAFKLVPDDPGKPGDDKPARVVELPRTRTVMLIQRIGYEVPTETEFRQLAQTRLFYWASAQRRYRALRQWFQLDDIRRRVGFRPKRSLPPVRPGIKPQPPLPAEDEEY